MRLGAKELRTTIPAKKQLAEIKKNRKEIYFILDSVLDTYNVGGIFRLADAIGVKKIYLSGLTETPPNTRIKKASINTTEWVAWEYKESALDAIQNLKREVKGIQIVAIEQSKKSIQYDKIDYHAPIAFVVGNETSGVSKEVLKASDYIAEIPMFGVNKSLNVIISLGIVAFEAAKNYGNNR